MHITNPRSNVENKNSQLKIRSLLWELKADEVLWISELTKSFCDLLKKVSELQWVNRVFKQ